MDPNAVLKMLEDAGVECYTRGEWGSARLGDYIKRRITHPMPKGPAKYHFVHITVTSDTDSVKEGKAGARQIEGYGLSTPPMCSYQEMVTNEAKYFQGQDYGTKGTHTVNDRKVKGFSRDLNLEGYALAIMQNVDDEVTDEQIILVAKVLAARELCGFVKRGAPVYPHRKFAYKACPGDKMVAALSRITKLKNDYVKRGSIKEIIMVRSASEAVAAATKQKTNTPGTCQLVTRSWYASASVGDVDKDGDADAVDGWKSEPKKYQHPGDRNAPLGAPVAFSGGSKGYGHRAISLGNGKLRSTDMSNGKYAAGKVGVATIEQVEKAMGVTYLGWSESIGGTPIPGLVRAPAPKPPKVKTSRGVHVDHALADMKKTVAKTPERAKLKKEAIAVLEKFPLIK